MEELFSKLQNWLITISENLQRLREDTQALREETQALRMETIAMREEMREVMVNMRNLIIRVETMHGIEHAEAEKQDSDNELEDLSGWKM